MLAKSPKGIFTLLVVGGNKVPTTHCISKDKDSRSKLSDGIMKNSRQCKRDEETAATELLKSIYHLMSTRSSNGSLKGVRLEGSNEGATMIVRGVGHSCQSGCSCNINIYINNNIQGVSNSVLVGSEVKMADPGVCFSMGDVKHGKTNRRRRSLGLGAFFLLFLLALVAIFLIYCSF